MSSPGGGLNFGPDWLTQAIENTSPSASPRTGSGPVFGAGGIFLGRLPTLGGRSASGGKDYRTAAVGSTSQEVTSPSSGDRQRHIYSSEQILSKFSTDADVPGSLHAFPAVLRRDIVYPRTFQPLSESEQRDLHLPVNSQGALGSRGRVGTGGNVDRTGGRVRTNSGSYDDNIEGIIPSGTNPRRSQQWGERSGGFGGGAEWRSHREKAEVAGDGEKWEVVDRFDSRRNSSTHGEHQQPTRKIEVGPDGQRRLVVLRPDATFSGGIDRVGSGGGFADRRTSFEGGGGSSGGGGGAGSDRFGSSSESMNWRRSGGSSGSGSFGSGRGASGASFSARDERLGRGYSAGGFRNDAAAGGTGRGYNDYNRGNEDNSSVPEWASEPVVGGGGAGLGKFDAEGNFLSSATDGDALEPLEGTNDSLEPLTESHDDQTATSSVLSALMGVGDSQDTVVDAKTTGDVTRPLWAQSLSAKVASDSEPPDSTPAQLSQLLSAASTPAENTELATAQSSNTRVVAEPSSTGSTPSVWYYMDPEGTRQGPFNRKEMSQWYHHGFFSESLCIRKGESGPFMPLRAVLSAHPESSQDPFLIPDVWDQLRRKEEEENAAVQLREREAADLVAQQAAAAHEAEQRQKHEESERLRVQAEADATAERIRSEEQQQQQQQQQQQLEQHEQLTAQQQQQQMMMYRAQVQQVQQQQQMLHNALMEVEQRMQHIFLERKRIQAALQQGAFILNDQQQQQLQYQEVEYNQLQMKRLQIHKRGQEIQQYYMVQQQVMQAMGLPHGDVQQQRMPSGSEASSHEGAPAGSEVADQQDQPSHQHSQDQLTSHLQPYETGAGPQAWSVQQQQQQQAQQLQHQQQQQQQHQQLQQQQQKQQKQEQPQTQPQQHQQSHVVQVPKQPEHDGEVSSGSGSVQLDSAVTPATKTSKKSKKNKKQAQEAVVSMSKKVSNESDVGSRHGKSNEESRESEEASAAAGVANPWAKSSGGGAITKEADVQEQPTDGGKKRSSLRDVMSQEEQQQQQARQRQLAQTVHQHQEKSRPTAADGAGWTTIGGAGGGRAVPPPPATAGGAASASATAPWAKATEAAPRAPSLNDVQAEEERAKRRAAEAQEQLQRLQQEKDRVVVDALSRGRETAAQSTSKMSFLEIQRAEEAAQRKRGQTPKGAAASSPWSAAAAKGVKQHGVVMHDTASAAVSTSRSSAPVSQGSVVPHATDSGSVAEGWTVVPKKEARISPSSSSTSTSGGIVGMPITPSVGATTPGKKKQQQTKTEVSDESFWDYEPSHAASVASKGMGGAGSIQSSASKPASVSPKDSFHQWCERELQEFASIFDVSTFVMFLQDLPDDEVQEYVKEYLRGSSRANTFTSAFLERRAVLDGGSSTSSGSGWNVAGSRSKSGSKGGGNAKGHQEQQSQPVSKGKKKKKGTKIDPSLLTFGVSSSGGANRGEIDHW